MTTRAGRSFSISALIGEDFWQLKTEANNLRQMECIFVVFIGGQAPLGTDTRVAADRCSNIPRMNTEFELRWL